MKKRLLNLIKFIAYEMPLKYSFPMTILSFIVMFISLFGEFKLNVIIRFLIFIISTFITILFASNVFKVFEDKKESNCLERLKGKLTNEFQIVSLKNCDDDFIKIIVEKAPYVFKAKIENDIVYYQFETKEGKILDSGETTNYLWFESKIL